MKTKAFILIAAITHAASASAQWDSGSDGSDGVFNPLASVEVDLGLAASLCDCDGIDQGGDLDFLDDQCEWDCPSPSGVDGVYDAERWVVVFKHTTIDIPAGVTITFKNHYSSAPVVWLASGNVTINGTVNLNGKNGTTSGPVPSFAEGGPGGWAGGQRGHIGVVGQSIGLGPGSTPLLRTPGDSCVGAGNPSAHVILSGSAGPYGAKSYDNSLPYFAPLHGGSGGTAGNSSSSAGGGGGGGAIFIACGSSSGSEVLALGSAASILADGGNGVGTSGFSGGGGSGGIIRLRAPSLSSTGSAQLRARDGATGDCINSGLGTGGIRIETGSFNALPAATPNIGSVPATPSPLFPTNPPVVRIVSIDAESVTSDPVMGILSTEASINSGTPVTVSIEAENIAVGQVVQVRVVPARGGVITTNSTALADAGGGLRTATATVTFPSGRAEVQVRWPVPP